MPVEQKVADRSMQAQTQVLSGTVAIKLLLGAGA
jgi:hypothetical protein